MAAGNARSVNKSGCCKTQFCNTPIFFIFKYNYLQLNTSLTEKSTIFSRIFTFPQTISLSNTKKSVMRGHTFIGLALRNIPRNHGWIAFPPYPLARIAAASSARLQTFLTLSGRIRALTRICVARKSALRRREASLISGRLRGVFPLGLPEFIRQTALPSVRGPDRARGCAAVLLVSIIQS